MSTIANTIAVAKVTSVLASRDVARGNLFPTLIRTEARFPLMITTEYMTLEGVYSRVPNYPNLQVAADYVYDLCGKYKLLAQAIVDGGGGGSVAPITPGQDTIYPIVVTGADFEVDGRTYNNPDIVGDNIMLFIGQYSQEEQFAPAFFSYTATGFIINDVSFDANNYPYIVIQKYSNG